MAQPEYAPAVLRAPWSWRITAWPRGTVSAAWFSARPSAWILGTVAAVLLGLAARLPYFAASDFPLNDGGMFVAMARDVVASGFALPWYTTYNFEAIPFAYPPLSFYVVALLDRIGLSDLGVARYLPLAANLASIVAVGALARSLLGPGLAAMAVPIVFALVPRSYEWLIMGGGLTRSIAFLLALACLIVAKRLVESPSLGRFLATAVLAALALTGHMELGIFALSGVGLLALFYARSPRAVIAAIAVAPAVVALTSPWWGTVIARHGLVPFDAASLTGGWTSPREQLLTLEPFMAPPRLLLSLPGALAVIGAAICVLRGQLFLPVWLPLVFLVVPRSAPSEGTVPLALLAGVALGDTIVPGIARAAGERPIWRLVRAATARARRSRRWGAALAVGGVLSLAAPLALVWIYWPRMHLGRHALDAVTPADQQAMAWIAEHTPADSQFLVATNRWAWEEDQVGEWFPVLAGRRSLLTPQGAEWLPAELHERRICLRNRVRELAASGKTVDDLDDWAGARGVAFSHLYVSTSLLGPIDWTSVTATAVESPNYRVLWDGEGVLVLERTEPIRPHWAASGELQVAPDCWSLADQPGETQRAFESLAGPAAARVWAEEHYRSNFATIRRRPSLCDRLTRFGIAGPGCPAPFAPNALPGPAS